MEKKLGLSALTALVLSSMLGAGVFSLPQNMAAVASPSALIIGWGITGCRHTAAGLRDAAAHPHSPGS